MEQNSNSLFATDVVIQVDNVTLGKIIVTAVIIFIAFFFVKKIAE